jgi:hypothetical protein
VPAALHFYYLAKPSYEVLLAMEREELWQIDFLTGVPKRYNLKTQTLNSTG